MTTTIAPGAGAGVLFTQQGVGQTPGFAALDDRRSNSGSLQEGVLNASDFMVTQRGAGANMSVDIGMPVGGFAYVQGDTINGQGLYCVPVHSATINEVVAAADATNPRIDSVILEVQDNALDASGGNLARIRVLTGTAQAGTTLTSRAGAPTLPGSALLLADMLVGAGVTSISNTVIRDRRKWARGAYWRTSITAGNYTLAAGAFAKVDAARLEPRIECSGVPIRFVVRGRMDTAGAAAGSFALLAPFVDGVLSADVGSAGDIAAVNNVAAAVQTSGGMFGWELLPSAGSHLLALAGRAITAAAVLYASASIPVHVTIEEVVRQNAANNTTTSG